VGFNLDGATVDVQTTCTPEQAESLLRKDIGRAEKAIEKLITAELLYERMAATLMFDRRELLLATISFTFFVFVFWWFAH